MRPNPANTKSRRLPCIESPTSKAPVSTAVPTATPQATATFIFQKCWIESRIRRNSDMAVTKTRNTNVEIRNYTMILTVCRTYLLKLADVQLQPGLQTVGQPLTVRNDDEDHRLGLLQFEEQLPDLVGCGTI